MVVKFWLQTICKTIYKIVKQEKFLFSDKETVASEKSKRPSSKEIGYAPEGSLKPSIQ